MSFSGNQYPSDEGFDLTTKGQVHTFSTVNAALNAGTDTYVLQADSGETTGLKWSDPENLKHAVALEIAASDELTALSVADDLVTFRMPYDMTLNAGIAGVRASLTTAGTTSGVTTIDIEQGGVSILSTLLTIDYGELTSYTAATPVVVGTVALTDNSVMTVNVDVLSGGATETGLKIQLIGDLT
jgi:hypothetical protein